MFRNANPIIKCFTHEAYCRHVVRTEDSGRTLAHAKQLQQRSHPAFHRVISFDYQLRRDIQPDLLHRLFKSRLPGQRRPKRHWPADESYPRMSETRQVLHRLTNALLIIDANIAHARLPRSHIHEHERDVAKTKIFDERIFHTECEDGNAVDSALNHSARGQFHSFGIVHRGREKYLVVVLDSELLKHLNDFWK